MAATVNLTVTKIDSTVYSTAVTMAINPENIITLMTQANNTVEVAYYDPTKVKLVKLETTTSVNTIFAAIPSPLLVGVYTIGTTTMNLSSSLPG